MPTPGPGPVINNSLRSEMERRRSSGMLFDLKQAIAIVVPLCTDAAQRHARGEMLFIHPSSILIDSAGYPYVEPELARAIPALPRDRACLAPEERHGQPGNARASVFAIGAILYELLTGEAVGPGMRRPTQVVPGLSPAVETILGKALVGDPSHRPDDLGALAQALHHLAPTASVAPPAADETHLDLGEDFAVDISLSLMPPAPPGPPPKVISSQGLVVPTVTNSSPDPYAMVVQEAPRPILPPDDPTARLADLKARLEADPRPRYVVIKDGMDHGPFNAVELLTQIGSHAFEAHHILRDTCSNEERAIEEWEEFVPFAEHSKLHREIVAEKKAIARVVVEEAKGTRTKTFVGVVGLAVILSAIGIWFFKVRGARRDTIDVQGENGIAVESAGGLKGIAGKKGGGRGATMGPGGIPILSGGMSCEAARAKYVEEINIGGPKGQADLTANQLGAVLNNGSYIVACGTPASMHVSVCAAIQNGRAVGVTVTTDPPNGGIAGCISGRIRSMSFPSNPKLDVTTTRF
jgi:eukaryotic-like serine/threonine-protein kinase